MLNKEDLQGLLILVEDRKENVKNDYNNLSHYKYMCELESKLLKELKEV